MKRRGFFGGLLALVGLGSATASKPDLPPLTMTDQGMEPGDVFSGIDWGFEPGRLTLVHWVEFNGVRRYKVTHIDADFLDDPEMIARRGAGGFRTRASTGKIVGTMKPEAETTFRSVESMKGR